MDVYISRSFRRTFFLSSFRLCIPGAQLENEEPGPSLVNDTVVDAVIFLLDDEGDVVDERDGVMIVF